MSKPGEILESSKHMLLRCKYGKLHLRTGGCAPLLQRFFPISHHASSCSVYLLTPCKKVSKEGFLSSSSSPPQTSTTFSISVSVLSIVNWQLSPDCLTNREKKTDRFCLPYVESTKYMFNILTYCYPL